MIKLLIVDDESLLRQGFTHMTDWSNHGFQIVGEAGNGKEALEIIAQQSPDLVVADIKMPVMDGIELTKMIKKDYPQIQIVILSSYDDFEYVRETLRLGAFDYILKPKMNFSDLLNVLKKASSVRYEGEKPNNDQLFSESRDEFLTDLMVNNHLSFTAIGEKLSKYHIQLKESNLIMLAVIFDSIDMIQKHEERQLLVTNINATIEASLNPISFFFNSNVSITMFNKPTPSAEQFIEDICKNIINIVNLNHSIHCRILISPYFNGYLLIQETFRELVEKIPYCFYFPKNHYSNVSLFQKNTDYLEFDFRILNTLAERFNFNELHLMVKNWVEDQISQEKYIDPYILKKFFSEVCYLIIYKYVEMGFYWEEVNEKKFEYLKKIENAMDYESLMGAFTEILTNLELFFTEHIQIKSNSVITEVIKYIHQNYDQNISLETTAKHFFIDKSYLCKLFKKHIARNFNDYLMQIRINKAKELLNNPEYTVNVVSSKVGYSDYSYFGRIFKKMVGITPSEYKKSLINTNK